MYEQYFGMVVGEVCGLYNLTDETPQGEGFVCGLEIFVCEGGLYVTFREGLENAFDGCCSFHTAKVKQIRRK